MANMIDFLKEEKATQWIKSKFSNESEIARFKSNLVAISNSNDLLQKASPATIMTACYQGVLLNLPMEKQFGYAYVVPYNTKITRIINGREIQEWVNQAQFQMGYKGYIQLAQRSGQYLDMSVSDVRNGELVNYDRLKGTTFNWIQDEDEREKLSIIGYVAYFKMVNGFEKTLYMTKEQMENHFMKYSKTYAKNKSFYIASFDEMALKTVLTSLLRKWGIMSVELQQAYKSDQAVITTNDEKIYIDNDITVAKNKGQMSDEPLSNNINTPSYTEIANTNDNVVKEEDISNVVPAVNNNDEEWATW
ncbi:recombinase RecT [Spiroplasma endosymbiont of Glossina fuscipes fuscipes]|uniref:recombinase RecT n=1 Tax=Spiroplasma endosymbiont of Glossina fuscipes fuscipes TaxID=2004463 RepID=UPI003C732620